MNKSEDVKYEKVGMGSPTYLERMNKLQRYSFLSPPGGGVRRVADKCGNWLEKEEAARLAEAADEEIHQLNIRIESLEQELEFAHKAHYGSHDIPFIDPQAVLVKDGVPVN